MARTNKDLRKTRHVRTAAQKRRDSSRKYCKYRRHIWVYADWPHDMTPRRVLAAMAIDTSGGDDPDEFDFDETWKDGDVDWELVAALEDIERRELQQYSSEAYGQQPPRPMAMADWERELLGADLPTDECEENEDYLLLEPRDEEPEWYGDHMLVTDDPPVDGYGMFRGVAVLNSGYGLDAIFGEGYLGGNCGFSVKTRP